MDGRTGLVIGGLTAVAASVAVVTAVALTNTAALQDSPGATVSAGRILVPAASPPTTTPLASAPTPVVVSGAEPEAIAPQAEIAEAPAPVVVDLPPVRAEAGPVETVTAPDAAAPGVSSDLETVIAAAKASGSWDAVRAWAGAHGWSAGRTEALVSRLDRELAAEKAQAPEAPVQLEAGTDQLGLVAPEPQERIAPAAPAPQPPRADQAATKPELPSQAQRPAHAGSNVGHGNGAAPDAKKDQSRNSPDKRD